MTEELMNKNLYELIGTVTAASTKEIKTAYRKKALSCHPDKNPDNPQAAELFDELKKALEILIDDAARAAYDKVLKARVQSKLHIKQLDAKRRKLRDDLEAREEVHRQSQTAKKSDEERLKAEIERLKKEGSKQVEEEIARINQEVRDRLSSVHGNSSDGTNYCIKIKWKSAKDDTENGGYHRENLQQILTKYGDISNLIISKDKKGSALVEYKSKSDALLAVQIERGLIKNPLRLQALWKVETTTKSTSSTHDSTPNVNYNIFPASNSNNSAYRNDFLSFSSAPNIFATQQSTTDIDYEDAVLKNLKRAEERRKLLEKMQAEDES